MSNPENELELQGDQRQPAMHGHGRLTITTEFALSTIKGIINMEGLPGARLAYKQMCVMFATVTGWTEIAQKINELFEKEVKRNSNRLLFLNKQPAFVNYGPYYEIQAGGICYANQDKDEGTIHSDMGNQVHEEEPCEEGDDEEEVEEAPSDEELVTKLKSIFYNNAEEVRRFLKEIHGMTPSDVTDLVNRWVKDKRISDYGNSRKGVLWSILHEAGLYPKSKTNWNRRVG